MTITELYLHCRNIEHNDCFVVEEFGEHGYLYKGGYHRMPDVLAEKEIMEFELCKDGVYVSVEMEEEYDD